MASPLVTLLTDTLLLLLECLLAVFESCQRALFPPALKELRGETAVVTGAGHGIGRELALQLARLGVRVSCWDINAEWSERTRKEIEAEGGEAWAIKCDVTDQDQVEEAARKTR